MPDSTEDRKALGLQIKLFRITKGWNQQDLANRSHITQASISRLESGDSTSSELLSFVLKALRNSDEDELQEE